MGQAKPGLTEASFSRYAARVELAVNPPLLPMLAKRVSELPRGDGFLFEPKWDGFRTLIFRDGDEVLLQSRDAKSLNRYFPELIEPIKAQLPKQCVLDGELVIAQNGALDFDALQLRVHPAASRVQMLSRESPASIVFFDLLCEGKRDLRKVPFQERREALLALLSKAAAPLHVTPATQDRAVATDWFQRFEGAGLDGVMAKPESGSYEPDKRVMFKVKHERECDCVVAGFRWHKKGPHTLVGSLLLGLYDDAGILHHVGVCASFKDQARRDLVEQLASFRERAKESHPWRDWADPEGSSSTGEQRMPGGKSRWSQGKDLSWEPLRPELVAEVGYDHMQGNRFRHTAQFRRFRSDKPLRECTYSQLEVVAPEELTAIFKTGH